MSNLFRCCSNESRYEIVYEIGTIYQVCSECSKRGHFVRGIKSKKELLKE